MCGDGHSKAVSGRVITLSFYFPITNKHGVLLFMNGLEAYRDIAVTTQTKGRVVVMLYEGAIKFLKLAISEIQAQNPELKGMYIKKALNIIDELNIVLDMEVGGEVAVNLRKLYTFMSQHLTQANIKQDTQKIEEVIKLLEELNKGWKSIV